MTIAAASAILNRDDGKGSSMTTDAAPALERVDDIERLCREHRVERLELFGSAASGRFRDGESDLDFLVTFERDAPSGGFGGPPVGLALALEALFGLPVDLVEEAAIRNPYFRQGVDAEPRTLLYASPDAPPRTPPPAHPVPEASRMELQTKKLLYDISQAAGEIIAFTEGKTFADYERDTLLRRGVERSFEIIGEAAARLARADMATARRISDYRRIIAFRNVIAHNYDNLRDERVWENVQSRLPTLHQETTAMLAEGG